VTKEENRKLLDIDMRERVILAAIVFFVILMGVYPKIFFKKMDTTVAGYLHYVKVKMSAYTSSKMDPAPMAVTIEERKTEGERDNTRQGKAEFRRVSSGHIVSGTSSCYSISSGKGMDLWLL